MKAFSHRYGENNEGHAQGASLHDFLQRRSNDFLHGNSTWPNSRHIIAGVLGNLPAALRAKLVRENVRRFTTFLFPPGSIRTRSGSPPVPNSPTAWLCS